MDPDVEVAVVQTAEHELVFVEFQDSVEVAPARMLLGLADRETVGEFDPPPQFSVQTTGFTLTVLVVVA